MEWVFWIVLLGTTTWLAVDASELGAHRGLLGGGFFDMGVAEWCFSCLLLWLVAFPAYLISLRDTGVITPAEFDVLRGRARDPRLPR